MKADYTKIRIGNLWSGMQMDYDIHIRKKEVTMGIYLNPGNAAFQEAVNSKIYVDKTGLLLYTNGALGTVQKNICVSRPRRFGKSMAANMLAAYYGRGCDSSAIFKEYQIAKSPTYREHLNKYDVIFLNIQNFLSDTGSVDGLLEAVNHWVSEEVFRAYPDIRYQDRSRLTMMLQNIFAECGSRFVFIIDEWDCVFREHRNDFSAQKKYLDFLRNLLKDRTYVALAYMTGILPVKKYGTHSALNMFDEYSMTNPKLLAEYVGFTEYEVKALCSEFGMDFGKTRKWYDGYSFPRVQHIYNPKSVVDAMLNGEFDSYWTQTETYEALKIYLDMNFDGLKDDIIYILGGGHCEINTRTFQNDMTTFSSKDDVFTLLVHLGYLAYDTEKREVFIPNMEIEEEFQRSIQGSNNENDLSCVISIAYYAAKSYYSVVREFPSGKGFADMIFCPHKDCIDKPALIVELKWDRDADGAITQIKERKYMQALDDYQGEVLLVGISYDTKHKIHECVIEQITKQERNTGA